MKELIGIWLMYLTIVVVTLGMSFELDLKEKLKMGSFFMVVISLTMASAYILFA